MKPESEILASHPPDDEPPINLSPPTSFPLKPSHNPTREGGSLPPAYYRPREEEAISAARELACRWSEANSFDPPLHRERLENTAWRVVHHERCGQDPKLPTEWCDCGFRVLVKFANRIFAVRDGGALEPYTAPPPTVGDLASADDIPFFLDEPKFRDTALHLFFGIPATSFMAAGKGMKARIVGKPGRHPIQPFLDKLHRSNFENRQ